MGLECSRDHDYVRRLRPCSYPTGRGAKLVEIMQMNNFINDENKIIIIMMMMMKF